MNKALVYNLLEVESPNLLGTKATSEVKTNVMTILKLGYCFLHHIKIHPPPYYFRFPFLEHI